VAKTFLEKSAHPFYNVRRLLSFTEAHRFKTGPPTKPFFHKKKVVRVLQFKTFKGRDRLGRPVVDPRAILKWILKKQNNGGFK
jgi:hypothetical protein